MKVLMFGWEFPPHISGGLGTACYGMTKGLLKQGAEVLFVVPKAYGDEDQRAVRLINASDVSIDVADTEFREFAKNFTYMEVGSNLVPYLDPEEFEKLKNETKLEKELRKKSIYSKNFEFSGAYGTNLMEEVSRYALVAGSIAAQYDFDVIHAHDWLTYYAGIAAQQVSGKPLVVHIHATEFDRTGEDVNTIVFDIEKTGMTAADRVIAVSNLTKKVVVEKHGIDAKKVFTVHNAIEPVDKPEVLEIKKILKEKVVTFLGRITYQKGPEYFIAVAAKVLEFFF